MIPLMSSKSKSRSGSRLIVYGGGSNESDSNTASHSGRYKSRIVSHTIQSSKPNRVQRPVAEPIQRAVSYNGLNAIELGAPPLERRGVSLGGTVSFVNLPADTIPAIHTPGSCSTSTLSNEQRLYWDVLQSTSSVFRVDEYQYVFQDWDQKAEALRIGVYYHLTRSPKSENDYDIACTCSSFKRDRTCLHAVLLQIKVHDIQRDYPILTPAVPTPPAVLLQTTPFDDRYIFSCTSSEGRHESGKRIIVSLRFDGRWHCRSDGYNPSCKHKPHAVAFATAAGFVAADGNTLPIDGDENHDEHALLAKANGSGTHQPVSHQHIPPPRWCSLPNETSALPPISAQNHFDLGLAGRCCCGLNLTDITGSERVDKVNAVLFGLTSSRTVTIDTIRCPACKHARRLIGPDLSECGLFNWNNTMIFSHQLLNAYINMYTASETPFSAFCLNVRRWYQDSGTNTSFCSDETFVRVWFAYVRLLDIDSKMTCPKCGPNPDVIIVDGVSLSTHVSKLTKHIQPPTFVDATSEEIESITSQKAKQLSAITQKDIRTYILKILDTSKPTVTTDTLSELTIKQSLHARYPEIAAIVEYTLQKPRSSPEYKVYATLLKQIAAPDIILQLVPYDAIHLLCAVERGESPVWLQRYCPALGAVLNLHRQLMQPIPLVTCRVAGWLAKCANEVYTRLAQHEPGPCQDVLTQGNWQETGTVYGSRAVRRRRKYIKLRNDSPQQYPGPEQGEENPDAGDCNKFYKTYSKHNLTGGIFVVWCTHSICLGFHSIPHAEGRNDVFSAIYTRFPSAPKVVIYDFACQLAPYCFVREASYFRHTRFLIDEMHAHDHTRCGQACFASNVMRFDNDVRMANTSAAECGNKGMKRIRKSVSFMIYEHAVIYTKTFLDVWNRNIMQRLQS
ncbi:hypothetical protein QCA50_011680 [Cerrena zonata]|uniref:SWIM-type domain-containing protein n=1 Tax=Cerrena zonata TaxID=2478898 RepID=A0AAW0G6L4_9APHY